MLLGPNHHGMEQWKLTAEGVYVAIVSLVCFALALTVRLVKDFLKRAIAFVMVLYGDGVSVLFLISQLVSKVAFFDMSFIGKFATHCSFASNASNS